MRNESVQFAFMVFFYFRVVRIECCLLLYKTVYLSSTYLMALNQTQAVQSYLVSRGPFDEGQEEEEISASQLDSSHGLFLLLTFQGRSKGPMLVG